MFIENPSTSDQVAISIAMLGALGVLLGWFVVHKLTSSRERKNITGAVKRDKGEKLLQVVTESIDNLPSIPSNTEELSNSFKKTVDQILQLSPYFPELEKELANLIEIACRLHVLSERGLYVEAATFLLNEPFKPLTKELLPRPSTNTVEDMKKLNGEYLAISVAVSNKISKIIQKTL